MSRLLPVILKVIVLQRRETHLIRTKAVDRPLSLLFMTFFTYFSEAGNATRIWIVFFWDCFRLAVLWFSLEEYQSGLCRWGAVTLERNGAQKAVRETSRKSKGRLLSVKL